MVSLAPEEKLDILFGLLQRRDISNAIKFFKENSAINQLSRFYVAVGYGDYNVYRDDEYLVITTDIGQKLYFVVGLDDNYNLFCHNTEDKPNNIRETLGFDKHFWEADKIFFEGLRIRLQGDIVITILKLLEGEGRDIYRDLYLDILWKIIRELFSGVQGIDSFRKKFEARMASVDPYKINSDVLEGIRDIISLLIKSRDRDFRDPLLGFAKNFFGFSTLFLSNEHVIDYLAQYLDLKIRSVMRKLKNYERNLNILIGRHKIKIIGILERDFIDALWGVRMEHRRQVVYILRTQEIVAYHPEHRTVSLEVPPSIIRIDTLRSGPLRRSLVIPAQFISLLESRAEGDYFVVRIGVLMENPEDIGFLINPYMNRRFGIVPMDKTPFVVIKDVFRRDNKLVKAKFVLKEISFGSIDCSLDAILFVFDLNRQSKLQDLLEDKKELLGLQKRVVFVGMDYSGNVDIENKKKVLLQVLKNVGYKDPHLIIIDPLDAFSVRMIYKEVLDAL